ncbi:unnamed protein product [Sphenostylis stenocarpa]|uniref:Uncharacterized protein n=1 Tax=Sphenostylis stenocarpa TaxID=92480 RepID=A0AA86RX58_9FABA|nr:unnamed protein product [Sphenostylis stenocarpa]
MPRKVIADSLTPTASTSSSPAFLVAFNYIVLENLVHSFHEEIQAVKARAFSDLQIAIEACCEEETTALYSKR